MTERLIDTSGGSGSAPGTMPVPDPALGPFQSGPVAWAISILSLLGLVATLFLPSAAPWLNRLDHWTADWRTAYLSTTLGGPHPRITLAMITDTTLREYASSPIDRGLLARVVTALDQAGARAIGIDIFYLKKTDPEKDAAYLAALKSARADIVLGAVDERGGLEPFQMEFQKEFLTTSTRPAGYLNLRHERDDVVRYTASPGVSTAFPKSFARLLAEVAGSKGVLNDIAQPISWLGTPAGGGITFERFQVQDLLDPAKAHTLGRIIKDRVVLIGGDFPLRDRHRTPLSVRTSEQMAGVEIHAHILAQLLDPARATHELGRIATLAFLIAVAALGFLLGWALWRTGALRLLGVGFATAVLVLVDALCFSQLHILLPFTLSLVTWVLGLSAGRFLHSALAPPRALVSP